MKDHNRSREAGKDRAGVACHARRTLFVDATSDLWRERRARAQSIDTVGDAARRGLVEVGAVSTLDNTLA